MKTDEIIALSNMLLNHPVTAVNYDEDVKPKLKHIEKILGYQRYFSDIIKDSFTPITLARMKFSELEGIRLSMEEQILREDNRDSMSRGLPMMPLFR